MADPKKNPYGMQGKIDSQATKYGNYETNLFSNENAAANATANAEADAAAESQYATPYTRLDPWVNANNAKDGGRWGRLNNRNYATTLRLAREADLYNNRPVDHTMVIGTAGPNQSVFQDLGVGYDKPNIQTMETRAMDQSFKLDTNQKELSQQLQAAALRKDYNAFTKLWEMKNGNILTKRDAEVKMREFTRMHELQEFWKKNYSTFMGFFGRYLSADTATTLYNLVITDPVYTSMLSYGVGMGATPQSDSVLYEQQLNAFVNERARALGKMPSQLTPDETYRAHNDYNNIRMALDVYKASDTANVIAQTTGLFSNPSANFASQKEGDKVAEKAEKDHYKRGK